MSEAESIAGIPTAHRAYPPPERPWIMHQTWHDLLFAHWPVAADGLAALLPSGLSLDLFEGLAWIGVVPFRMSGLRPRGLPALPRVSAFPELNVRTYVCRDGRPGVWFFSLDAAEPLAVASARRLYHLAYFTAQMQCRREGPWVVYASRRLPGRHSPAAFAARYRPAGPVFTAARGSLEWWLTERYCLYTADPTGCILRGEIHHGPWPLQPAEAEITVNTMTVGLRPPAGAPRRGRPSAVVEPAGAPHLLFAERLDVLVWGIEKAVGAVRPRPD